MLKKIFALPQKTFLKTRDARLVTLWVSGFICLAALCVLILASKTFQKGLNPGTASHITIYSMLAISLVTSFVSFIILVISLQFKSVEEEKYSKDTYQINILESLKRISEELFSKHVNESHLEIYVKTAQYLKQELTNFPASALSQDSVKILLKGISNNLAIIYIILADIDEAIEHSLLNKPKNWEQYIQDYEKKCLFYIQAKENLQKLYEQIEKFALNNNVKIVKNVNPELRYLVYADSEILSQMKKLKSD